MSSRAAGRYSFSRNSRYFLNAPTNCSRYSRSKLLTNAASLSRVAGDMNGESAGVLVINVLS